MENLVLQNITKDYGSYHALSDINIEVRKGEFVVIVGPSGCGKSTLLKSIAGLETISSGRILIGGRDVTHEEPSGRGIAMVFQSYALYPHMTVAENLGFGLKMLKRPKAEIVSAVKKAAEILRLTEQLDKLPMQLSGGQRQRVAIGRAITRSPEVFLFDEPLSNLDAALRTQMRVELAQLHASLQSTMIYVTHDQVEAMTLADRIVVLNAGRVEQIGAPTDLYQRPSNLFVAGFLGSPRMNFFKGRMEVNEAMMATVNLPELLPFQVQLAQQDVHSGPVIAGLRPEAFTLDPPPGAISFFGKIKLIEALGRENLLHVDAAPLVTHGSDTGTQNVAVYVDASSHLSVGMEIKVGFDPSQAHLFGGDGNMALTK